MKLVGFFYLLSLLIAYCLTDRTKVPVRTWRGMGKLLLLAAVLMPILIVASELSP